MCCVCTLHHNYCIWAIPGHNPHNNAMEENFPERGGGGGGGGGGVSYTTLLRSRELLLESCNLPIIFGQDN